MLDDVEVNLISLKHLKANKRAAGRLKDLADLEYLPEARHDTPTDGNQKLMRRRWTFTRNAHLWELL